MSSTQTGLVYRFLNRILYIFFKLLYHQCAWAYDWVADSVSIGRWKSWINCVLPYLDNSKVLELGCGPGYLQLVLAHKNVTAFGLDVSPQMLKLAAQKLSDNNQPFNLVLGNANDLPYPDQSFHRIVSTFPSDYINDPETLSHAWRVLIESGELIILPAAWITGETILDKFAAWLFTATGEASNSDLENLEERYAAPIMGLEKIGFQVGCELIELPSSKVLIIRAVKKI